MQRVCSQVLRCTGEGAKSHQRHKAEDQDWREKTSTTGERRKTATHDMSAGVECLILDYAHRPRSCTADDAATRTLPATQLIHSVKPLPVTRLAHGATLLLLQHTWQRLSNWTLSFATISLTSFCVLSAPEQNHHMGGHRPRVSSESQTG